MPHRLLLVAIASAVGPAPAADPAPPGRIEPTRVTVRWKPIEVSPAGELPRFGELTGIPVGTAPVEPFSGPTDFDAVPAWDALTRIADKSSTRIVLSDHGRRVGLAKRTGPPIPAATDGPFRVAVRQVDSRIDLDTGSRFTDVTLDLHWEPRLAVLRVDGQPTITAAADDRGSKLTAAAAKAKVQPTGAIHTATVRLDGVPRTATKLTELTGMFTVTAAPRLLPFAFPTLPGKLPAAGVLPAGTAGDGVAVVLKRFEKVGDVREAELDLTYPPGHPEFESFESWTARNEARLVSPDRSRSLAPADAEVTERGRSATAVYRFKLPDPAGWSLGYDAPAALRELPVRFALKDIPLP